jgi:signal transduction histidine kinase
LLILQKHDKSNPEFGYCRSMINRKRTDTPSAAKGRRRFIYLVALVTAPILILTSIGTRALHLEAVAVRTDAVQRARDLADWATKRDKCFLFPGNLCWDGQTGYKNLISGPMLHPVHPEDDFVVRMHDCSFLPGFRFQACLLDQDGNLAYPKEHDLMPGSSGGKTSVSGAAPAGWETVRDDHERSRGLYRQFRARLRDSQSLARSRVFAFLGTDAPWVAWRVQLGDSGYQVLVALPQAEFQKLAAQIFDPRSRPLPGVGPDYPDPEYSAEQKEQLALGKTVTAKGPSALEQIEWSVWPHPKLDDDMQLAILEGSLTTDGRPQNVTSNPLFQTGGNPMVTSATQAGSLSAVSGLGMFMQSPLLAYSDSLTLSEGEGRCSFIVNGDDKKSSFFFRAVVSLVDPDALLARVRWHTWGLAGIIAISAAGACTALAAAWRAFRQQERLNEMKSNFISSVSHELRAPLASVRLMAESLERGSIREPEKQAEYFRLLVQESKRVSGLVENVLDLSRIEQGRKRYSFESCDLARLFNETVSGLQPYAADKQVRLELTGTGRPVPIDCDGIAMQQVLVNLVDNAVKHSPPGETVRVNLAFMTDKVRFSVADLGPGIPPEDHERIFEPFFRRGSELRRETQGVGLGLSIVRHAVRAHGGSIALESDLGEGSCFVVVLPATREAASSGARP